MSSTNLDDMLSNTPTTPEQSAVDPAPEPALSAPTGEIDAAPPAEPMPAPSESVPQKALLDERRKRQELQRRLEELEAQIHQTRPQPEPQAAPDWELEPKQAASHFAEQLEIARYQDRVSITEEILREKHTDYDEVAAAFAEAARNDPHMREAVFKAPNPARYAYQAGKMLMLMRNIGNDPDSYRAKIEAEVLAKYGIQPGSEGQSRETTPNPKPPAAQVPRSLARDVSQVPRNSRGQFDSGPAPLEDLIG